MNRKARTFLICLIVLAVVFSVTGCVSSDKGERVYSAVVYAPETDSTVPYTVFAIGKAPFDYTEIRSLEEVAEPDTEEYSPVDALEGLSADIVSMVSPLYEGPSVKPSENEGVGTILKDIAVVDEGEEENSYHLVDVRCFLESEHAFFYYDTALEKEPDVELISTLAALFDENYAEIRDIFGEEADIDGNGRIRFIITDIEEGTLGFYYPLDQYNAEQLIASGENYKSNESDLLYLSSVIFDADSEYGPGDIISTMCHEFSHMAYSNGRDRKGLPSEEGKFLNEGLAMWLEYHLGFTSGHDGYILSYLEDSDIISALGGEDGIYGMGLLFFRYFESRFGLDAIKELVVSEKNSIEALEDVTGWSASAVFEDFATAVLATSALAEDSEYYISSLNNAEEGFNLAALMYLLFTDRENSYYNLSTGDVVSFMEPYTVSFFVSYETPDFESADALMLSAGTLWL